MTKLEPCPRCRSPFVEVHDEWPPGEVRKTRFICAVCALDVRVPMIQSDAVSMWNTWRRDDANMSAARTAENISADLANRPTRLERLVVALMRGQSFSFGGQGPREVAAELLDHALAIERELDK